MSRAVTSNTETTSILNELPLPPQSTPQPQFPSSSPSVLESQHGLVHSVTLDQPKPAYTLSTTLLPSASPSPTHTHSLTPSTAADEIPGILSTFPSPSTTPAPFSIPTSDFEYLPSATVDQPEHAPTLSSTPPFSPPFSSTFLPSPTRLATEDQPEPESASMPSITPSSPALPSTSSLASPSIDDSDDPEFESTPFSSSPTSSTCLHSVTEEQPEPDPEPMPLITPASTFASTSLSSSSSTFLPNPVISATGCQPASEPTSTSESSVSKFSISPRALPLPLDETLPSLSSLPILEVLRSPEISTPDLLPVALPPNQSSLSRSLTQLSRSSESESAPMSAVDIALSTSTKLSEPESLLPAPFDVSITTPIPRHSTSSQRHPRPEHRHPPLVYELSSTFAPRLPLASPPLSRSSLARFSFAFVFITTAALVSTFFNVSADLLAHTHKFRSKQDIGNSQNGTFKTSKPCNTSAQQFWLGQYTPHPTRFIFDPGGQSSSFKPLSTQEDIRQCKMVTHGGCTTLDTGFPIPV
ncbi:hypothetical protein EDB87DRAFT_1580974 [Lactarius vividus]|nr:hypothetical protein EDB87DRAFT_1580974 [Lactarius vividus]